MAVSKEIYGRSVSIVPSSSAGRAPEMQAGGCRFKTCSEYTFFLIPLKLSNNILTG